MNNYWDSFPEKEENKEKSNMHQPLTWSKINKYEDRTKMHNF